MGRGYVSYTAEAKPGLATGSSVQAQANIIFDRNAPISTPVWSNSIDNTVPSALVATLPAHSAAGNVTVRWSGDDGTGSGIASYNIYATVDGGPLTLWKHDTTATSAQYPVTPGRSYGFAAQAINNVGTEGPVPTAPQTTTEVTKVVIAVTTVAGTQTFGSSSPVFSDIYTLPTGADVTGSVSCSEVTSATKAINAALAAGNYTVKATTCGGLSATTGDYSFTYAAKATGFNVTKAAIAVATVGGSQTYGSSSSTFTGTYTKPTGATVTGTITCSEVTSATKTINAALAAGNYTVKATTCGGLSATTGDYSFTYAAKATGFKVTKAAIAVATVGGSQTYGSSSSTFTGTYTKPTGATVTGTITCSEVTSATKTINAALAAGNYTVKATTCGGLSATTGDYSFTYAAKATGFKVIKAAIAVATVGGSQVVGSSSPTFMGTYTKPTGATVTGAISCTEVTSATKTINAALAAGTYTVKATTCGGLSTTTGDYSFTYAAKATGFTVTKVVVPTPSITAVTPSSGTWTGGTKVTISGHHLTGTTRVLFGSTPAASFTVKSATSVQAITPVHTAGKVGVSVDTTHGDATKANAFTFIATAPTVLSVAPSSGPTVGGTSVVIAGTNFAGTKAIKFGSTTAASFTVNSETVLMVKTPAHDAGTVSVTVVTTHGTATKAGAFTFLAPASTPPKTSPKTGTSPPAKTAGYDMVGSDGGVFVFSPPGTTGGFFGSLPGLQST